MPISLERKTKETEISLKLELNPSGTDSKISVATGIPFFDHMLHAMAFHGNLALSVRARGDLEVDYHHTVEDVGIVLGNALRQYVAELSPIIRYGNAIVVMDEALSEAAIDLGGRAYLVYDPQFPQERSGVFEMALFREFFVALAANSSATIHLSCRYGENSHHMIEALFKALGRALNQALQSAPRLLSTKGLLNQ